MASLEILRDVVISNELSYYAEHKSIVSLNFINSRSSALVALDSRDPSIQYHAAWWLGKHRIKNAVPKLLELLTDEKKVICVADGRYLLRRQIVRALGLIGDKSSLEGLINTLWTDDPRLHEAAIRSLVQIGDASCIESLIKYFDVEFEQKPVESLIEALTVFKVWHLEERIKPYLSHPSARVLGAASAYLFAINRDMKYLDAIKDNLSHQNKFIRQSAVFDLALVRASECISDIIEAQVPGSIKLYSLKIILESELKQNPFTKGSGLSQQNQLLFEVIDDLTTDGIEGNLVQGSTTENLKHCFQACSVYDGKQRQVTTQRATHPLESSVELLKSSSIEDRFRGIEMLVNSSSMDISFIKDMYSSVSDQDVRAGLIQAMALLLRVETIPELIDTIGLEVSNHCQGRIRRVAARALGAVGKNVQDEAVLDQILEKLVWTLRYPDDWALRYSAAVALEDIGLVNIVRVSRLVETAILQEKDLTVLTRLMITHQRFSPEALHLAK